MSMRRDKYGRYSDTVLVPKYKLPELRFHAVLGDGTRELRFERLLAR